MAPGYELQNTGIRNDGNKRFSIVGRDCCYIVTYVLYYNILLSLITNRRKIKREKEIGKVEKEIKSKTEIKGGNKK